MPANTATLARCLDLRQGVIGTFDRDAAGWTTRAQAEQVIRDNPYATGMRPMRACNAFFVFWVAAMPVHVSDVRVVVRYLRAGHRSVGTACVDRPDGLADLTPAVPALTAVLAARLVGRRVVLCDTHGDEITVTLSGVDGDYVYYRHPRTGRMVARHVALFAVVRGAVHKISYSAGRQVVNSGPPLYNFAGRLIEHTGYFYSAWCSCGGFSVQDSIEQVRRAAVRQHLHDVGHDHQSAPGSDTHAPGAVSIRAETTEDAGARTPGNSTGV